MSAQPIFVPFQGTPQTPEGHLALHFVAAARYISHYLSMLGEISNERLQAGFLETYCGQVSVPMGSDAFHERLWWAHAIGEWEKAAEVSLPLRGLEAAYGVDFEARLALLIAGIVEEDSRFGALFADLQAPLEGRRPTVETLGRILTMNSAGQVGDTWSFCSPLLASGLLESLDSTVPRVEQILRVPAVVWDAIRGTPIRSPLPGIRHRSRNECATFEDLIYPQPFLDQLDRTPGMLSEGRARILAIRHGDGADFEEVAGAIARRLNRGLLVIENPAESVPATVGPLCAITGCLPLFVFQLKPGDTAPLPRLPGYAGPILAALGLEGGLRLNRQETTLSIQIPFAGRLCREQRWRQAFGETKIEDIEEIRDRFQLEGGHIHRLADAARLHAGLSGRAAVRAEDVRNAGRLLNRHALERLAHPVSARGSWSDLVTVPGTRDGLTDIERRCRRREELADLFGPRFGAGLNRGVRGMFIGSSGTGKTMAAGILAAELGGMELYRVDLASVINKYIGETESNLHEVLTRAEALDVILLIDEGDALMGRRTDVKSSNDRYANLETNFLLQRLETYQGIVIVTTNLSENIDPAFQRRMDVVVHFHPPDADGRRRILDLHLPENHGIEESYLNLAARRCAITGGQIRNAVLQAATHALDEDSKLCARHLQEALAREYQKAGATFPLANHDPSARAPDGGFSDFVSALNGHRG